MNKLIHISALAQTKQANNIHRECLVYWEARKQARPEVNEKNTRTFMFVCVCVHVCVRESYLCWCRAI